MKNKAKTTIENFMNAWKAMNYSKMYDLCQLTWKVDHEKSLIKKIFNPLIKKGKRLKLKSYSILDVRQYTDVIYDVDIKLTTSLGERNVTARLICEYGPFNPSLKGSFGVNPVSIIKNLY